MGSHLYNWATLDLLESRLDAPFYSRQNVDNARWMNSSPGELTTIDELTSLVTDGTHVTPDYVSSGVPFISARNIDECHVNLRKEFRFISQSAHERLSQQNCVPATGDLLVAKSGKVGTAAVNSSAQPFSVFESVAIVRFGGEVDPYFAAAYLNSSLAQHQILRMQKGAVQKHLHLEEIRELRIPVVSSEIQNAIGNKIRKAERLRAIAIHEYGAAEDEMSSLVSEAGLSPGDIRSGETFVELSSTPAAWLLHRSSFVPDRLDANYYAPTYLRDANRLDSLGIELRSFESLCVRLNCGATPKLVDYAKEGTPFIRTSNVRPNSFDDSDVKRVSDLTLDASSSVAVVPGDILYTMSGTVGNVAVYPSGSELASCSNTIARGRIRHLDQVDPYYVACFLNSPLGKSQSNRLLSGGVLGHVMPNSVKKLKVLLPHFDRQRTIGDRLRAFVRSQMLIEPLIESAKIDCERIATTGLDVQSLMDESSVLGAWLELNGTPQPTAIGKA